LLAGDNRSGKTVAGAVEATWWLTGRHPYIKTPEPPVYGRVITVDFDYGADQIIVPKMAQWIPPSELINGSWEDSYNKKKHLLKLRNGSELEIKAHGQALESFAGTSRHFLWCDEEPPRAIFNESKIRLLDYNGRYWMTLTPVDGSLTWVYDELVEGDPKNVEFFSINIRDNPHISQDAIENLAADLDDEEKAIRLGGGGRKNFIPRGGLVYKEFDYDRHVIDPGLPPVDWTYYTSVDHGFNNPTAWLWHAVSPRQRDGTFFVVTFREHYRREWTVAMHAQRVHEIDHEIQRPIFLRVGDPSMAQREATTGHSVLREYAMHDVRIKPAKKHKDNVHIDRTNDYFRTNRWLITRDCPNLIREVRKLPWKRYQSQKIADLSNKREEALEKDDHACDSAGYFARFMPDLSRDAPVLPVNALLLNLSAPQDYPWRMDRNLTAARLERPELGFGEVW
jgi:phage terminase large subunit-like protein